MDKRWPTHVKHDVRIPIVERSIALLWPSNDVELLHPPDLQSLCFPCILPCCFLVSRLFTNALLELKNVRISIEDRRD